MEYLDEKTEHVNAVRCATNYFKKTEYLRGETPQSQLVLIYF